nr:ParB N-terminal domain-containing protein [Inquilinus sp. Marseille-Q2685]
MNGNRGAGTTTRKIALTDIIRDAAGMQVRDDIDRELVESYARSMARGEEFPPVEVFEVEGKLFLVDGFHRCEAAELVAENAGQAPAVVEAKVKAGSMAEATEAAALANTTHGKGLTRKELREAFRRLAGCGALDGLSSREMAAKFHHKITHVTAVSWAEEFPGLVAKKPKKGAAERPRGGREPDPLSATQAVNNAAISNLLQVARLVNGGNVTDPRTLDQLAEAAEDLLAALKERGGDAERARNALERFEVE